MIGNLVSIIISVRMFVDKTYLIKL